MHKVIIRYLENDGIWRETSYSSPDEVSDELLIWFFGLKECKDYKIIR